jgi:hypothetical protein
MAPHGAGVPVDVMLRIRRGLLGDLGRRGEAREVETGEALKRGDFDWETNRAILHELLEWLREPG